MFKENVLVTGACGQLGRCIMHLVRGYEYESLFRFTDIVEDEGIDILDITDAGSVGKYVIDNNIKTIINCAAYTNVDKAESDKENAIKLNTIAPEILAEAMHDVDGRLIHISTDYVFCGASSVPYMESNFPNPLSVYGSTKWNGEVAVRKYNNAVIIRTSWLYSEYGKNFVKTMLKLFDEKEHIKVVFDQIGCPTYARDLANAVLRIAVRDDFEEHLGIYHFCNKGVCSWYDFAMAIKEISGKTCHIEPCNSYDFPTPVKRPYYSVLDCTKISKTFNDIHPQYWRDALLKCIENLAV